MPGSGEILNDVWSGSYLRELTSEGRYFSSSDSLALILSTDGVPVFKSSSLSLWPVYLIILNLPPGIRMNSENVLMAGLWYGKKPAMNLLLTPIIESLNRFSTLGISITTPEGLVTIRTKLVMGVFDLPAKSAVLCAKQFNGKHGCSVCLHPGTLVSRNHRVYLPGDYVSRTHYSVVADAERAKQNGEAVNGIISNSPLTSILDLVDSIPVDYMHAVLEGVTRLLLKAWFLSCNHGEPYYLGNKLGTIDKLLLKQRPPCELSRPPRSLAKHMKYWKASELRNWLLYYSLPLLLPNLPSLYLHHYALLVCAMHILLQNEISAAQIDAADEMLHDFCLLLPELYGETRCTHNAHLLTHLAKYVRLWGPLWTHSAFGFESMNGQLKNLFHSKSQIFHQLMFNVDVRQTLQLLHSRLAQVESEQTLCFLQSLPRQNMLQIDAHTYILGQSKLVTATVDQRDLLRSEGTIEVFSRLYMRGNVYTSKSYSRGLQGKRNNTVCVFKTGGSTCRYGEIEIFVNTSPPKALIRVLKVQGESILQQAGHPCRPTLAPYKEVDLLNKYVTRVTRNGPLTAVPLRNIEAKVVLMNITGTLYAIKEPNQYEHH